MATSYQYKHRILTTPEIDVARAEELAAFLLNSKSDKSVYEDSEAYELRMLPLIVEKFPDTITCVKTCLFSGAGADRDKPYFYHFTDRPTEQRSIYDKVPEYDSSLTWMVATNEIRSTWESHAIECHEYDLVSKLVVPDEVRAYLVNRLNSGRNVSIHNLTEKGGMPTDLTLDDKAKTVVKAWYINTEQEAWGDRSYYVYFDAAGALQQVEFYYSIGD